MIDGREALYASRNAANHRAQQIRGIETAGRVKGIYSCLMVGLIAEHR